MAITPPPILVLLMADNLKPEQLPAYKSLCKFHQNIEIVIFTNSKCGKFWSKEGYVTDLKILKISSYNKLIVLIRKLLRNSWLLRKITSVLYLKNKKIRSILIFIMPIVNSRYYFFLEYLNERNDNCKIIICDARDLIFQINPIIFLNKMLKDHKVILINENVFNVKNNKRQIIKNDTLNTDWINRIKPTQFINSTLGSRDIVNGGFIMGENLQVKGLLTNVLTIMQASPEIFISNVDQAALNIYSYENKRQTKTIENGQLVLNMCSYNPKVFIKLSNGILYADNNIIPVVHMFDRYGTYEKSKLKLKLEKYSKFVE
jgi:hypothetical protein